MNKEELTNTIRTHRGMTTGRKISDGLKNVFTYLSSALAILVLGAVFVYVFQRGWNSLSWNLLTGDYHPGNYMADLQVQEPGEFAIPENLPEGAAFSVKYGIAVKDDKDAHKASIMTLVYMDEKSPLTSAVNAIAGSDKGKEIPIPIGSDIRKISYFNAEGAKKSSGLLAKQNAEQMVQTLDAESKGIAQVQFQSTGGGIRGSLLATLMVIALTLLITLPLGVFGAIYLHEVAGKNKLTSIIRSAIEMLNGVPSIVFGLMGMAVFFPITAAFGATTPNILLGAITMAVVLLPVVIRQTEEALITVPDKLRMGSLSLGATKTQTIFRVVLPNALPGILTASLLSISRVIGESAALIYTMGTFVVDKPEVTGRATTLAVQIWSVMSGEQPNFELASAISIIILVMVLILNISVKVITSRLNQKWKE